MRMDTKQNPFSLYDFLGYFLPGAIFVYGALLLSAHSDGTGVRQLFEVLSLSEPEHYVPFVIISYAIGHILSLLSAATVERYSIWTLGYPSYFLFNETDMKYFDVKEHKLGRWFIRVVVFILLLPISVTERLIGVCFGLKDMYARKIDDSLAQIIQPKIKMFIEGQSALKIDAIDDKSAKGDYFRYIYHYAVDKSENHLPKMQNYVALYGFLRNMSLLSTIVFWFCLLHFDLVAKAPTFYLVSVGLSVFVSFCFYMGFVKFYRRFTLEAIMACAVNI